LGAYETSCFKPVQCVVKFNLFIYVGVNFNFKYPFLYLLTALVSGILCSDFIIVSAYVFFATFFVALLFLKKNRLLADVFLVFAIFVIGIQIAARPETLYEKDEIYIIESRCEEILSHNNYILSVNNQQFYLSNFQIDTSYNLGDSLRFNAKIMELHNRSNPGEFNYNKYLNKKGVYHQLIPRSDIEVVGSSHDIRSFFNKLRDKLIHKTERLTQDTIAGTLINALFLGYKDDIDAYFRDLFVTTGTVHLLSVSGLHTGAIYLLLVFIFKHIGLSGKKTSLALIPILWGYACLTGLSPSVVRASTILSFVTVGRALNRSYTPLNSLSASAFFTLLIEPNTLYSLSFLLSYSAYAGIMLIYPFLYNLPGKLPPIVSSIYSCCCITIAAQLPTLPIGAYYFHTININGFLANIVAVPIATIVLYSSAICLALPFFISKYLIIVHEFLCSILVSFLELFAPYSVNLNNLYPSAIMVLLLYLGIIVFVVYLLTRKRHWLYVEVFITISLLLYLSFTNIHLSSKSEIAIFHYYHQTAIIINHKGYYSYIKNTTNSTVRTQAYIRQNKLKSLPEHHGFMDNDLFLQDYRLIGKKDTILLRDKFKADYSTCKVLIITDNLSPTTMFRDVKSVKLPQKIIIDGSSTFYTIQKWEKFCYKYNIELQKTTERGFICFKLK